MCWSSKQAERIVALLGLLVLPALAAACTPAPPPAEVVVAEVGDRRVTFGEFESYLRSNALESEDERVLSRMLDALVEQTTLLSEAERRGILIGEDQIDRYLGQARLEEAAEGDGASEDQRRQIRQRLMVLELQRLMVGTLPEPSESELHAHVRQMGWGEQKRVRLRSLRFDDVEDAERVSGLIASGRMTFAEAVVTYETDPGQGLRLDLAWNTLSPEIQAAVEPLEPGQVSPPLEFTGEIFIFQLDSWFSGVEIEEELLARARGQLVGMLEREARSRLLQELSAAAPTRIHEDRLPFRYHATPG